MDAAAAKRQRKQPAAAAQQPAAPAAVEARKAGPSRQECAKAKAAKEAMVHMQWDELRETLSSRGYESDGGKDDELQPDAEHTPPSTAKQPKKKQQPHPAPPKKRSVKVNPTRSTQLSSNSRRFRC